MKVTKIMAFGLLSVLVLLCSMDECVAQKKKMPVGLDTGKAVPDLTITSVFEKPGRQLRFPDYKGKVVILDFWGVYCSACLQGMPEMDSLQRAFGEKIKIILVTKDKSAQVKKLFDRIHMRERISHLDVITDDTVLSRLFPHQSEPHHVWIDRDGIYRYGTFFYNATGKNIQRLLNDERLAISQKQEDGRVDPERPLIQQISRIIYPDVPEYSLLLKGMDKFFVGGAVQFVQDSVSGKVTGFHGTNLDPLSLLQCAFDRDVYGYEIGIYDMRKNYRMLLEVKDTSSLFIPLAFDQRDKWFQENSFCYEVKSADPDRLFKKMQNDLNGYLRYEGRIEKRRVLCYALTATGPIDSLRTKGGAASVKFKAKRISFNNQPIASFIRQLTMAQGVNSLPIIDKTGIEWSVDITASPAELADPVQLNIRLKQYNLALVKKTLAIPMLIIKNK